MNENCCFCGGSGFIEGARTMAPAVPAINIKRVKSKAEKRFERQLAKPGKLVLPIGRQCPHCKRDFQSGKKLTRHIISDHADVVQVFRCPDCTKPFLEELSLQSHRQNCRMKKLRSQPAAAQASSLLPVTKSSENREGAANPNKPKSVYQDTHKEQRLDGSRGTHLFRDQGRFGSHSSHDDHGEESKP